MPSTYNYNKGFFTSIKNNKNIKIVTNKELFKNISKEALEQLESISKIKEVSSPIFAMPDIHIGFGVPIGSVFVTNTTNGIISSEAVGYDINCGIRIIKTNLFLKDLKKEDFLKISKEIKKLPLGLSSNGLNITEKDYKEILTTGVNWCLSKKYCNKDDVSKIYHKGCFENADISKISKEALKRGKKQIGTLGQGNHFIDILEVSKIFNKEVAKEFGLLKGQLVIMLHSGSRGLGHQIATDYYKIFKDKEPISHTSFLSKDGQNYFKAMNAAANFAFVNRAVLSYLIEERLKAIFVGQKIEFSLIYDLTHNLATLETHASQEYLITRKGATRVFLPEDLEKTSPFKKTGSPIILPGSMLDFSYILVPDKGVKKTFSSVAHGSGRSLSRKQAKEKISFKELKQLMEKNNIILEGISENLAREEQPDAYKSSNEVISSMEKAKMVKKVAQLKPVLVILG
jgi:tRNA-splicing ligase RtcB (3'-phosphate/5'-hydroxy nucleic acid ligase)